jgi:hypothetical protein
MTLTSPPQTPVEEAMPQFYGIGEAARLAGCAPHYLSTLFYRGILDANRCGRVGGRIVVPAEYLDTIKAEVERRRLKVPSEEGAVAS